MNEGLILIGGAARFPGREIARSLAASRRLLLWDRSGEALSDCLAAWPAAEQPRQWVRDPAEVAGLVDDLRSRLEAEAVRIEHFVHCAGTLSSELLSRGGAGALARTLAAGVYSALEVIKVLTGRRSNAGALRSILLVSLAPVPCGPSATSPVCGALGALARALAVEFAPDLRVNALVVSAGLGAAPQAARDGVAGLAEFLLSDAARWITGQELFAGRGALRE